VAAVALLWALAPSPARAGADTVVASVAESSVCTLALTVQLGSPASLLPPAPTAAVPIGTSGSGTCYGTQTLPLSVQSISGGTVVAPSCVQLTGALSGSMVIGATSYPVAITIAGATAAPLLVIRPTTLPGPVGVGALTVSPASLTACLQGGTATLQYSGVLVIAG
jgi:hypothetical protein